MAFQEAEMNNAIDIKKYLNKPLEGYYLGFDTVNTKLGETLKHNFQKTDGTPISVWGFTQLNYKLNNVPHSVLCQITYLGTQPMQTKFGMKDVHQCKVLFDMQKRLNGYQEIPNEQILNEPPDVPPIDDEVPF